jgi:hypothetical protein
MKKIALLFASLLTAAAGFAQTEPAEDAVPNRILVTNTAGNYTGFVIDYLDQISFARVDGDVLAKVEINEVYLDSVKMSVTRTPECMYYKLAVVPTLTANQITNDVAAIRYVNSLPSDMVPVLFEDFTSGVLSGIKLNPESDYTIYTIGVDNYGVESGVFRADFTTPAPEITGNPHVDVECVGATLDSFTMKFTPNNDVQFYYILAGETGTMQKQYEMFAPMFGFSNFSDMIKGWGIAYTGQQEYTWTDMAPNTEYEVFVAMTDVNGYFAPYETFKVSTVALGGHGEALVEIELGDYFLGEWDNEEMIPTQEVIFYPNEESSCYRYALYTATDYDAYPDAIKDQLCSDPPMPMVYWFFYDPMMAEFQIPTSSEFVAIAAAKNVDGKWGAVTELRFTTPDECEGYVSPAAKAKSALKAIAPRKAPKAQSGVTRGVLPQLPQPLKVELK